MKFYFRLSLKKKKLIFSFIFYTVFQKFSISTFFLTLQYCIGFAISFT